MVKEFTQWPEFVIEDIETLKALADARRIRIVNNRLRQAPQIVPRRGRIAGGACRLDKIAVHIKRLGRKGVGASPCLAVHCDRSQNAGLERGLALIRHLNRVDQAVAGQLTQCP